MHDCYGHRAASKALNGADERDDDGDDGDDGDGGRGKDNVDDDDDEDGGDGDGDDSDCEDVHGAGAVAQTGQTPTPTGHKFDPLPCGPTSAASLPTGQRCSCTPMPPETPALEHPLASACTGASVGIGRPCGWKIFFFPY